MILRIELPGVKPIEHLESVFDEIKKGFSQGTLDGCEYRLTQHDEQQDKIETLDEEKEALEKQNNDTVKAMEKIKKILHSKDTIKNKTEAIDEILDEVGV